MFVLVPRLLKKNKRKINETLSQSLVKIKRFLSITTWTCMFWSFLTTFKILFSKYYFNKEVQTELMYFVFILKKLLFSKILTRFATWKIRKSNKNHSVSTGYFCDFRKKGPRPKWTIYKDETKIRNFCLSVILEFCLSSSLSSLAYTSLCRGLKYLLKNTVFYLRFS